MQQIRAALALSLAIVPAFHGSALGQQRPRQDAATTSVRLFDGSTMNLAIRGERVSITYRQPSPELGDAVQPGELFFEGTLQGVAVSGTAYAARPGCPPNPFPAQGLLQGGSFTLSGAFPRAQRRGCWLPPPRNPRLLTQVVLISADRIQATPTASSPPRSVTPPPPQGQPRGAELTGMWSGRYECPGQVGGETELEIGVAGGELVAHETVGGIRTGTIDYRVTPAGTGQFLFTAVRVAINPARPIREFDFAVGAAGTRRLEGGFTSSPHCTRRSFAGVEDQRPEFRQRTAAVLGGWRGTLQCLRTSPNLDVVLEVGPGGRDRLSASLRTFPRNMQNAPSDAGLIGEWDPQQNAFRFAQSRGFFVTGRPAGLSLSADGDELSVSFVDNLCRAMTLARLSSPERNTPTRQPARGDGAVFQGATARARCDAIIAWLQRLRSEFNAPDLNRANLAANRRALVFGDDDFVPAFGTPFDRMSDEQKESLRPLMWECRQDPLVAQRLRDADHLMRGFSTAQAPDSFGALALNHAIANQREARHALRRLASALQPVIDGTAPGSDEQLSTVAAMRSLLQQRTDVLWPSEVARAEELLASAEGKLFDSAATRELAALANIREPREKLSRIAEVLNGRAAWFTRATTAWRTEQTRRLEAERYAIGEALVGPYREAMAREERTLEAIERSERASQGLRDVLPIVDERTRRGFTEARSAWVSGIVSEAVAGEMARLERAPGGREGLRANAEMSAAFQQRFAGFRQTEAVRGALSALVADRRRRLRESISEFEREVQALAAAGHADVARVSALAREYLNQPADWRDPIALEYRLVAAVAGTRLP